MDPRHRTALFVLVTMIGWVILGSIIAFRVALTLLRVFSR